MAKVLPNSFSKKRPSLGETVSVIPAQTLASESRQNTYRQSLPVAVAVLQAFIKQIRLPSTSSTPMVFYILKLLDIKSDPIICIFFTSYF